MRILSVGGGSGGHVTPVVAVLRELKAQQPHAKVRFWCDNHYAPQARSIMAEYDPSLRVQTVLAGKLRRYNHLTKLQHLTIPSVIFPNILDSFLVFLGVGQSLIRLIIWRPDVVFANGGYVCLPVGLATWLLGIPLVIHDADAVPGLTNRLLAPLATRIGTGLELDYFDYPPSKAKYVGIAIDPSYQKVTEDQRKKYKKDLGFDDDRPLTVFTGGGQGSSQINDAVAYHLDELLKYTNVLLLSGAAQYDELRSLTPLDDPRFVLKDFVPGLPAVFGAADIVVSRAGATALLELAAMAMPTIIIPSQRLVWQVAHAKLYADKEAVLLLDEDKFEEPEDTTLLNAVKGLLDDPALQNTLASNLHKLSRPKAAQDMASLILLAARKRR